ncbi:MAG: glycoside hydrolase family 99-like domain-containing protein [Prevotella sp.]|jgi:lipopolysaccharide biosynthesis protein|nr:glycoside hydrolase family 99-like domain-containing protein [Prevotella sp.]
MIRPVAIYLPQFHPIPENDEAWGKGFTEWTNVAKAKPLFKGHYQPHVPHEDIGYYDLRDPEILVKQAAIAKKYGIYGFAFYHYWFNGKQLLNKPLDNMLQLGKPDFPFLYIWANENWTKRWDGLDNEIIIKQDYSFEDDMEHIKYLCEHVFCDERYIKIDDKPVFIIYRTELFPNIKETVKIWRKKTKEYGYNDLYLIRIDSFIKNIDPLEPGFDAAVEFAPDFFESGAKIATDSNLQMFDYHQIIKYQFFKREQSYPRYRMVFPAWDNTARKEENGAVFRNSCLDAFRFSLEESINYTARKFKDTQQFLFINAWNEWGEGCHIEPDKKNGYSYLEIISKALNSDMEHFRDHYLEDLELELKSSIMDHLNKHNETESLKRELNALKSVVNSRRHRFIEKLYAKYQNFRNA